MANYTLSNWVIGQAKAVKKFNDLGSKEAIPHTFNSIAGFTEIMVPNYQELRLREDRDFKIYSNARTYRALGSTRDHDHVGSKGSKLVLDPVWTTQSDKFAISQKQAGNNIDTIQEMMSNEMMQVFKNFSRGNESNAQDFIFQSRSQVNNSTNNQFTWDATDFVSKIDEASFGEDAALIVKTIMEENDYDGELTFYCDSRMWNRFYKDSHQGQGNNVNLSFQFDGITFVKSKDLNSASRFGGLVGTYNKGVGIAVPNNTIAYLDWIPEENRKGVDTKVNMYGNMINPIDNLQYGVHIYPERANDSANNGMTQDVLYQHQLAQDGSFLAPELTDPNETVLQAFALI